MPVYDYLCEPCDAVHELFVLLADYDKQVCPDCGVGPMPRLISPVATVGPMPSKPLDLSKQLDRKFYSNGELRAYHKEHPEVVLYDPKDSAWQKKKERARDRADRAAKRGGYDSVDHQRREVSKEAKKRAG